MAQVIVLGRTAATKEAIRISIRIRGRLTSCGNVGTEDNAANSLVIRELLAYISEVSQMRGAVTREAEGESL